MSWLRHCDARPLNVVFAAGRLENPTPQRCRAGGGGDDRGSPSGWPGELTPPPPTHTHLVFVCSGWRPVYLAVHFLFARWRWVMGIRVFHSRGCQIKCLQWPLDRQRLSKTISGVKLKCQVYFFLFLSWKLYESVPVCLEAKRAWISWKVLQGGSLAWHWLSVSDICTRNYFDFWLYPAVISRGVQKISYSTFCLQPPAETLGVLCCF